MATWNPAELERVDAAHELEISSSRDDDSLTDPVTIWAVRVGDDLYVRSVRGDQGGWYRSARNRHRGRVEAGGVIKDVDYIDVGTDLAEEIDAAYKEKYGWPSSPVEHITSAAAAATTLRVVPR